MRPYSYMELTAMIYEKRPHLGNGSRTSFQDNDRDRQTLFLPNLREKVPLGA